MSISIRASHKIADLATLCTLVNAWAVTTRVSSNSVDITQFVSAAKFLPHPIPLASQSNWSNTLETVKEYFDNQPVTKMFVFDPSTIASLKAKVVCDAVPTPTRVDVVSAVIRKCLMKAGAELRPTKDVQVNTLRRKIIPYNMKGVATSSYLIFNVNIRKRIVPPLPNHCVGNVVAVAKACKGEDDGYELSTLVASIRKGLSELITKYVDKLKQDEAILAIPQESSNLGLGYLKGEIDLYINSWCGYQIYEIDFGRGKPSWFSPVEQQVKNFILLMDSSCSGGINAWVCLMEKEMEAFQHELLDVLAIESAK